MGVVQMLFTVSSGESPGLTFFPNGIALSQRTSIKTSLSDRLAHERLREDELISSKSHRKLQEGLARLLTELLWNAHLDSVRRKSSESVSFHCERQMEQTFHTRNIKE